MTEMAPEQAQVADLSHTPVRDFTLRSAFALAFSDVSPIVGIYSVFFICLITAGPAFFWGFPVVLIGQLAVTGVFGDLVSKWPFQGCVYQWARELFGARYGWFTNWAFSWGLVIAMGAVALFAAEFLGPAMGLNSLTQTETSLLALGVLLFGTIANMIGRRFLRGLLYVSMTAELIASLGIGIALLFFHRTHSFSFLFSGAGTAHGGAWLFGPFLTIVAFIGFSFVGFESAGSIAEEVKGARHVLPKAISLSLLSVGLLVMFATLGLILALPDLGAVLAGKDSNPIATTLEARLGGGTGRALLVMLTIGFTASMIAVQASVSRAIWASARAHELPFHGLLGRLSGPERLPRHVIGLTFVVAGILVFIHNNNVFTLLLSGATAGFFVSYALPVVGAAITRLRGGWSPGPVSMGKAAATVTYFAAIWMVVEIVNIAWPRNTYGGVWYLNWGIILAIAVLGVVGVMVSTYVFRPGSDASSARFEPVVIDPEGE